MANNTMLKKQNNHLSPFSGNKLKQILSIFIFGLGIGILMALLANLFVYTVEYFSQLRQGFRHFTVVFSGISINFLPILTLIAAASLINVIRTSFSIKRWNGPADTIYAAHRTDNQLDDKVGYLSSITALISASGGASVGQYGPLVHLGATIGTTLKRYTKELLTTDVFLGCGVAGAISAGFGAPLAGIIFAHEAILRHFSMRALAPIAISSFTATAATNAFFGKANVLRVPNITPELVNILPTTLLCAPIFALVAILFMWCIRSATKQVQKLALPPSVVIYIAAIGCGVTGMFFPQILGLGTETVVDMLSNNLSLSLIIVIFALKIVMTSLCLSSGLFGGVFSPALFVGTAAGAIIGKICAFIGLSSASLILPFCGMAAVGGAVIGAPVTAVIIILEITNSYELGLVTMVSVAGCCLITHLFFGHSFFDRQLIDRGINVNLGRGHLKLMEETISKYSTNNYCSINEKSSVKDALEKMLRENYTEAYVLTKNEVFCGKIIITNLIGTDSTQTVDRLYQLEPLILRPEASVLQSIEACRDFVGESIPIVCSENKAFIGVISESDLFAAYLDLDKQIRNIESG